MGGRDLENEREILSKMLKNYNTLYGGNNEELQTSKEIRDEGITAMDKLMESVKDNPELLEELNKLRKSNEQLEKENKELKKKERRKAPQKSIENYDIMNFKKFLKTEDGKHIRDEFKDDDSELTAFDTKSKIGNYFRDYQFEFIKNWSISVQELVILYYGTGSGKTLIAINCAEQYTALNNNTVVFFFNTSIIGIKYDI
jgi:primosomal protein N'